MKYAEPSALAKWTEHQKIWRLISKSPPGNSLPEPYQASERIGAGDAGINVRD